MSKQYPQIEVHRLYTRPGKHPLCKLCGELDADAEVTIQVNYFRGDDEVVRIHRHCYAALRLDERVSRLLDAAKGNKP